MANAFIAYALWFTIGFTGAQHFYLRRPANGLLWLLSFGGLGLGWLSDLINLTEYVLATNDSPKYREKQSKKRIAYVVPPGSFGQYLMCYLLAFTTTFFPYVFMAECANRYGWHIGITILPVIFFRAAIVYLHFSINEMRVQFKNVLFWSFLVYAMFCIMYPPKTASLIAIIGSIVGGIHTKRWEEEADKEVISTWFALFIAGIFIAFFVLISARAVQRMNIKVNMGEGYSGNFQWGSYRSGESWRSFFKEISNEGNTGMSMKEAYSTLGLKRGAPEADIISEYRRLSRQWHPDRHTGEDRRKAEEMQIKINAARDRLIPKKSMRQRAEDL